MGPIRPYNPSLPLIPDWRAYALLMLIGTVLFTGGFIMTRENKRSSLLEGSGMMVASLALLISLTGGHFTAAGSELTWLWAGVLFAGAILGGLLAFRIKMEQRFSLCAARTRRHHTYTRV